MAYIVIIIFQFLDFLINILSLFKVIKNEKVIHFFRFVLYITFIIILILAYFTWDDPVWLAHYSMLYPIELFSGILWLISFPILRFIRRKQSKKGKYVTDNYKY